MQILGEESVVYRRSKPSASGLDPEALPQCLCRTRHKEYFELFPGDYSATYRCTSNTAASFD